MVNFVIRGTFRDNDLHTQSVKGFTLFPVKEAYSGKEEILGTTIELPVGEEDKVSLKFPAVISEYHPEKAYILTNVTNTACDFKKGAEEMQEKGTALVIFIQSFALDPLLKNAELMNDRLNVLEPFIAVANSSTLILILPLAFLTMIADFPKIDTSTVFSILRTGRYSWLTGQIIKLLLMAVTFLFVILAGSVIPMLPRGIFRTQWSRTFTDFLKVFPETAAARQC